jgi:predicted alpha/beta hydrolase family esterase
MAKTKAKRRVLFIHGAGPGAHEADSKLAASLQSELGADWEVVCPKLPEKRPEYPLWAAQIARAAAKWDEPVFFVGHSFGGSLLLKYLSEQPTGPSAAGIFIIAAPYWGSGGWSGEEFALKKDFASSLPKNAPVFLYQGRDDNEVPFAHLALYREKLPRAQVRELPGRDHQLNDDLSETARDMLELA